MPISNIRLFIDPEMSRAEIIKQLEWEKKMIHSESFNTPENVGIIAILEIVISYALKNLLGKGSPVDQESYKLVSHILPLRGSLKPELFYRYALDVLRKIPASHPNALRDQISPLAIKYRHMLLVSQHQATLQQVRDYIQQLPSATNDKDTADIRRRKIIILQAALRYAEQRLTDPYLFDNPEASGYEACLDIFSIKEFPAIFFTQLIIDRVFWRKIPSLSVLQSEVLILREELLTPYTMQLKTIFAVAFVFAIFRMFQPSSAYNNVLLALAAVGFAFSPQLSAFRMERVSNAKVTRRYFGRCYTDGPMPELNASLDDGLTQLLRVADGFIKAGLSIFSRNVESVTHVADSLGNQTQANSDDSSARVDELTGEERINALSAPK